VRIGVDVRTAILEGGHTMSSGYARLYIAGSLAIEGVWVDASVDALDGFVVSFSLRLQALNEDAAWMPVSIETQYRQEPRALRILTNRDVAPPERRPVIVSTSVFEDAAAKDQGRVIPYVVGGPGTDEHPGSPLVLHDVSTTPETGLVHVGETTTTSATLHGSKLNAVTDTSGVTTGATVGAVVFSGTTFVDVAFPASPGSNDVSFDEEGTYWVSWSDGACTSRGAGDVCLALMDASTVPFDQPAWDAIRPFLNSYQLDGFVDAVSRPAELLQRHVWSLLPLQVRPGPRGFRPVLASWVFGERNVELVASKRQAGRRGSEPLGLQSIYANRPSTTPGYRLADFSVASDIRRATIRPASSVTIRYGYDAREKRSLFEAVASASEIPGLRYDPLAEPVIIEARWLWDDTTANRVAMEKLRALVRPPVKIAYTCDPARYGPGGDRQLLPGDAFLLTDERVGISARAAVVSSAERTPTEMRVELRVEV
jgi:hypothetical protein